MTKCRIFMYLSMEYSRFILYNQRYNFCNSDKVIHDMPRIRQIYICGNIHVWSYTIKCRIFMYLSMEYIKFTFYNRRYIFGNWNMVMHDMPRIKHIYMCGNIKNSHVWSYMIKCRIFMCLSIIYIRFDLYNQRYIFGNWNMVMHDMPRIKQIYVCGNIKNSHGWSYMIKCRIFTCLSITYIRFDLYNQRYIFGNSGMVIHDMPRTNQMYICGSSKNFHILSFMIICTAFIYISMEYNRFVLYKQIYIFDNPGKVIHDMPCINQTYISSIS